MQVVCIKIAVYVGTCQESVKFKLNPEGQRICIGKMCTYVSSNNPPVASSEPVELTWPKRKASGKQYYVYSKCVRFKYLSLEEIMSDN